MQQFLDFIAVFAFVVAFFSTGDIFFATAVLLIGVSVQVALYLLLRKPIGNELKMTFWASMILGGLTLILRNETFIQWKPSILNWLIAMALVGSHWVGREPLIKRMLGKALRLPDAAWRNLSWAWGGAFTAVGFLNLWVAYNFSMETWVTFKLVGLMGLNIVFMVLTFVYLYRQGWLTEAHLVDPEASSELSDTTTRSES